MKKQKQIRSNWMFCICAAITASAGWLGLVNTKPVLAAESVGEEIVMSDAAAAADIDAAGELSENSWGGVSKSGDTTGDENLGVYDFKDNKTTGTVTVTKVWDDDKTNEERAIPDIKISTTKPSKSTLGYTVTFHGNGLKFADGTDENMIVYNSAGEIVQGKYKMAVGDCVGWCTGKDKGNRVVFLDDGTPQIEMTGDLDLWAKEMTFEIKGHNESDSKKYNDFNYLIPDTVTEIFFTDEIKPAEAEIIDVDADGDGGVVAWTENDGVIMKVSTQIKDIKVQAAKNSGCMFYYRSKLTNIDLSMLDTSNVTNMSKMFQGCNGLTTLDLSPLDTQNVKNMLEMFSGCRALTTLDLSSFDTHNVTDMKEIFMYCWHLAALDLSSFDTQKVTDMTRMFSDCNGLTTLDLSPLDTQNVKNMLEMFSDCSGLTALDLPPLDTQKVTDMTRMFYNCSGLTALDLSSFDTQKVTDMGAMFSGCRGLTTLDLSPIDTQNVVNMSYTFSGCSSLTSLDLSPFDTQNVTNMYGMFYDCSGLTTVTTGPNFKFVGTDYYLSGTWQNTAGETFNGNSGTANFPSNIADTYTKISN